jgi:hypothetical protein
LLPTFYLRSFAIEISRTETAPQFSPNIGRICVGNWQGRIYVINPTKAKILETMAPTPSTLKRRKVLPTRVVKKTKDGTGQRQTPTDSNDEEDPVVSPYK